MTTSLEATASYRAIDLRNVSKIPQWGLIDPDVRDAIEVVGHVLPFRTNQYVMDDLIDWSRVPDDPIFQLVFPQQPMLEPSAFARIRGPAAGRCPERHARQRDQPDPTESQSAPGRAAYSQRPNARWPPPAGVAAQVSRDGVVLSVARADVPCLLHVLLPLAQFVGLENLKFQASEADDLVEYLKVHPEVTDVLITGGDPMIMRSQVLRKYIEPLLSPELEHVQNIRIGTKSVAYWPHRFVSNPDADDCLQLFEEVVASGRHMAIMGHYSHPVELEPEIAREATRRIRNTGTQIRMQAPLIRHVNDEPEAWATLWKTGVRLGLIPYYMFVERDTGARNYFEVPLVECYKIFKEAYSSVSGLARSVRGPSMSAFPGKVRILGVVTLRDIMDSHVFETLRESLGFDLLVDADKPLMVCDFIQARDPAWVRKPFFATLDENAAWFDDLRPAFGKDRFYFETTDAPRQPHALLELTELLLE